MGKLAQKLGGQSQSQIQTKKVGGLIKGEKESAECKKSSKMKCGGKVK